MRVARPTPLPLSGGSENGGVQLHRGLLQPAAPSLGARLPLTPRLRAGNRNGHVQPDLAQPSPLTVHRTGAIPDFELPDLGKVAPYGVYDLAADAGWVNVGVDADTAAFAVESIRRWWQQLGQARYPEAKRLVITADCGGSNGVRVRLWKRELQRFANETGLAVTVAHLPPGTSKWNRIEHRLFAAISQNWRGKPLVSHQVIVQLIGATTTQTGLTVRCELDANRYPKGIKVTDAEMAALAIERDAFHGEWNYTIAPNQQPPRSSYSASYPKRRWLSTSSTSTIAASSSTTSAPSWPMRPRFAQR